MELSLHVCILGLIFVVRKITFLLYHSMSSLSLRSVEDSDIAQLRIWLNNEHVLKWYHDANEWLNEINERHGAFNFLNHFIVLNNNMPIGFCQFYDCNDAQEDWYTVNSPGRFFSIDYFIGDKALLGRGYGKKIVKLLVSKIQELSDTAQIIVQPETDNKASCGVLVANNFVFDNDKGYFILKNKV